MAPVDRQRNYFYYVGNMAKREFLGEFEHVVLLALLRLGSGAYGMLVRGEIEARTGRSSSIGAVHATLERLERKKYVSSWIGEPTPERGGKAKRQFSVNAAGIAAIERSEAALRALHAGLTPWRVR